MIEENIPLVFNTKTSLKEEAKRFLPTVREFYPNLDEKLIDRIAKYCVVYFSWNEARLNKASIRQAINDFEEVFDIELV
tara:strand:- start:294 stop:530 length:237 start_codon:yes stop_codon:yes gene_type:complete